MVKPEFATQMQKLVQRFGDDKYPAIVIQRWWETFEREEADSFRNLIAILLSELQFAPTLPEAKKYMAQARAARVAAREAILQPVRDALTTLGNVPLTSVCRECLNVGRYGARFQNNVKDLICDCEAGQLFRQLPESRGIALREQNEGWESEWRDLDLTTTRRHL